MGAGAMPSVAATLALIVIINFAVGAAAWQSEGLAGPPDRPEGSLFGVQDGSAMKTAGDLDNSIRSLLYSAVSRHLLKSKPSCTSFSGYYGSQCTGSPGFWTNSNGWCLWPAQTITVGTLSYSRDPQCWDILAQGTSYDITKMCYQLIPAILGRLNFARSGASVPSNIDDCINLGNAMIGDRVINPVGDGLCTCCATNSCNAPGSTSVCRDPPAGVARDITTQGCTPLDGSKSYTNINTVINCLGSWNVNGECAVTPA
ncbi:hypothetical protein ABPG77_009494 [Micractinium sp. CCAP 211/92]